MTAGLLLDASTILAAIDSGDANHEAARELLYAAERDLLTLDLARYEVANVTTVSWSEPETTSTILAITETLGGRDGLIRSDMALLQTAAELASRHSISVYDAAYAAAAILTARQLVSCDQRDLVANGLAVLPAQALA